MPAALRHNPRGVRGRSALSLCTLGTGYCDALEDHGSHPNRSLIRMARIEESTESFCAKVIVELVLRESTGGQSNESAPAPRASFARDLDVVQTM